MSAVRAGLTPWAVDLFADRDLAPRRPVRSRHLRHLPRRPRRPRCDRSRPARCCTPAGWKIQSQRARRDPDRGVDRRAQRPDRRGRRQQSARHAGDGHRIHARGILYAPDYVINAGGIINVSTEYLRDGDQDMVRARIEAIPAKLEAIWQESAATGRNAAEVADAMAQAPDRPRARAAPAARFFRDPAQPVLAIERVEPAGDDDRGADPGRRARDACPRSASRAAPPRAIGYSRTARPPAPARSETTRSGRAGRCRQQAEREQDRPGPASCAWPKKGMRGPSRPSRSR